MIEKKIKQIVEENKGKEIHLIDFQGIFGELPLTDMNLEGYPVAVEINDSKVNIYIE